MASIVLGIDTSGSYCSVALAADDRLAARVADVGSAHAEHVLSMVDAVLSESGFVLADCDAIAYAAGPGSFTGLRVGCAVAQGLAFGADARLVPVGTLDAIAQATLDQITRVGERILVAQDARMDEVYWATFERTADRWVEDGPPTLTGVAALSTTERARAPHGTGNAWTLHGPRLSRLVATIHAVDAADALDIARLGQRAHREGASIPPDRATLLYVRDHVALTIEERAVNRAMKRDDAARISAVSTTLA